MNSQEYYGYMKNQIPVFAFSSQAKGFFSKIKENDDGALILPDGKAGLRYSNDDNIAMYYTLKKLQKQSSGKQTNNDDQPAHRDSTGTPPKAPLKPHQPANTP